MAVVGVDVGWPLLSVTAWEGSWWWWCGILVLMVVVVWDRCCRRCGFVGGDVGRG